MLPTSWRRLLSLIRILLAMSCLATQLISSSFVWTDTAILFAVYIIYACIALFWRSLEDSGYPTLALIVDFVFFFIAAISGAAYGYWISSVFYAYVLLVAVMLHPWWKTVVVAVAAIALLYLVPTLHSAEMLRPAFIAAGILGSVLAIQREYLEERLSNSSRQTVLYRYDAEKARESERQRIAADFHDGPLQSFISFQMRLEIIRKLLTRDLTAATEELLQLQDLCKSQVNELRAFVRSMRPVDVEGSLNATLRRVVEQFQKDSGIPATFRQRRISGAGRARGFARAVADRSRGAVQRPEAFQGHARGREHREIGDRARDSGGRQRQRHFRSAAATRWMNWSCCGWVR